MAATERGRERRRWLGRAAAAVLAVASLAACTTPPRANVPALTIVGGNYAYAVYDNNDALLHSPFDALESEIKSRQEHAGRPITDIFVLIHGWDYTVEESFGFYEGYRSAIEYHLAKVHRFDPDFEPYFIFVVWSSVTRPLSDILRSLLPWTPPRFATDSCRAIDDVAFRIPSAWGESQDAVRLAMGPPLRWEQFDLRSNAHDDFQLAIDEGVKRAASGEFVGFEVPVSLLLEELMYVRDHAFTKHLPPALHVVGHSFGAKLGALAVNDALQRTMARELVANNDPTATNDLIDSLVLVSPAMEACELYWELPLELSDAVKERHRDALRDRWLEERVGLRFEAIECRIGSKVLIYSKYDSANGWVFGLGDSLLDHDAAARAQTLLARDHERPVPPERTLPQKVITFPLDVADRILQVTVRGIAIGLQTAISDTGALFDGVGETVVEMGKDWPDPVGLAGDLLKLPFSPLYVQRAIGNKGFYRPRSTVLGWDPRSWLDDRARDYLEGSQPVSAEEFLASTVALGTPPCAEGECFLECNARKVFTGSWQGGLSEIIPPGAHGDMRSTDPIVGPGGIELTKRERTMNFIYNVTRGTRLAHGAAVRK